jgi:amino acid adenylation domain-containing protein
MVGHFTRLLEAVAARPEERLTAISLLSEDERRQIVVEWNQTQAAMPKLGVHQLFQAQAEARPDATALILGDQVVTYGELNQRANQLAHFLRKRGVGVETPVALCCERSLELIVGILGILKAGGVYVPLDPSYPADRLKWMLQNTQATVLITAHGHDKHLPEVPTERLQLDVEWERVAGESTANPASATDENNLAYIIYTSGSTGQPKGVAVEHRAITRLVRNKQVFRLSQEDTFALLSPITFDASTLELWGALTHGARLAIFPPFTPSLEELAAFLEKTGVTVLWLTSGLFHQMVETQLDSLRNIRQLLTGGDVVSPQHLLLAAQELPDCVLINGYGPTENTTFTACHALRGDPGPLSSVPIGKPITNTTVFVLDEQLGPVPVGVAGQLYTGGGGLARGYFGQPAFTAEKFIPNPFSSEPGARLYNTGDRVRWRNDGALEFLGRHDQQVKVRGFRIELEEIQAALAQIAGVNQAVAIVREDAPGDKRLVAYIVAASGSPATDAGHVQNQLRAQLPEYMVPGAIVLLEEMPLTQNGKVDRAALPAPVCRTAAAAPERELSPVEGIMADIWAEVLKTKQIGVNDNFFDLGGHSLLATQIVSRVCRAFSVTLPLRTLFECPTVAQLAEQVEQALASEGKIETPPIGPVSRDLPVALSFAQQRLWFLDQLAPGSPIYNMPFAVALDGRLNVAALESSLAEIVQRHEMLRTVFPAQNGEPYQRVNAAGALKLPVDDLSDDLDQEQSLRTLVAEEAGAFFDLSSGPLLRARLLRMAEDRHALLINMHHIVSDGWSMGVFMRELSALYQARVEERPSPLRDLRIQYADFACWQRRWLSGAVLDGQLEYWRKQLEEVPMLELPTDFPRPTFLGPGGAVVEFNISAGITEQLKALGRSANATLFMTLLAAFQFLLGRYADQDDVTVGTLIANRNRPDTEDLIGFFVNTLVLRTRLGASGTFRDLLRDVRGTMLEAYAHQDLPFERLVVELAPVRHLGRTPLFQVMFELQAFPFKTISLPEITVREIKTENTLAKFELNLVLRETDTGMRGFVSYSTELFSAESMERMSRHYVHLLESAVAGPDLPLRTVPLLSEEEESQVIHAWEAGEKLIDARELVHERIARQARSAPDAIAAIYQGRELTYRELNARAAQLAAQLRSLGCGTEKKVAIHLERSPEALVAVLAVLKSGAAYIPLDPSYPQERLAYMVQDSGAGLLLTESRIPRLKDCGIPVIDLDGVAWEETVEDVPVPVLPQNIAYVIYTSGSTGLPKGVMVTHGSLARTYAAWEEAYELTTRLRTHLQMAAFSFDVFTGDFVRALCSGGTLVLCPRETLLLPEKLYELLRTTNAQFGEFVPAVLRELVEYAQSNGLPLDFMRLLVCSSDMWYAHEMERTRALTGPDTRLVNSYGLTECTIDSSWFEATDEGRGYGPVPIGQPYAGNNLYILDREMMPVPAGVTGELYIGGENLARGYLGQPGLTADRYVPDPFARTPGARLYRTGDRVRALPDGNIEMLGRADHQIKLRGVRIELAEVEAALAQHPSVVQAAVVVHGEGSRKILAAYVAKAGDVFLDSSDLRAFLLERLPLPAVPSAFTILDRLPTTDNGKIDRRSLPAPEFNVEDSFVAPRTPLEQILAGIWMNVLNVDKVGVHDNFFELGGHSLLVTQVISRIRGSLGLELPVGTIFEEPTIAGLVEKLRNADTASAFMVPPAISRCSREDRIPLSFAQQRLWFLDQLEPGSRVDHVPALLRLNGELNSDVLSAAFDEIVRRHEVLRTSFPSVDGHPYQMISPAAHVPVEQVDLRSVPAESREARLRGLMDSQIQKPFDLLQGPLLRVALYRMDEKEHVLCLTVHHIISDAWSVPIFARELNVLYNAFLKNEAPPLPELPLQYADVAVWEREWLRDEVLERHLRYWREKLEGSPQVLELPADFTRPAVQSLEGGIRTLRLSTDLSRELKKLGNRLGATEFMTVLALMNVWLFRYSGQTDILVGTPISNRNQLETEALIGLFVNSLVFRTRIEPGARFVDLLDQVRKDALGAYAHQALPFEKLVDELRVARDPSRNPLFQVMFNIENEPTEKLEFAGVMEGESIESNSLQARFDFHLGARPTASGLELIGTYNAGLFKPATVVSMLENLAELARLVVEKPESTISELAAKAAQFEQENALTRKRGRSQEQGQQLRVVRRRAAKAEPNLTRG